jgi:hypothetical protein
VCAVSEEFAELLRREAGIRDNSTHGEGVYGVVPGMVRIRLPSVMAMRLPYPATWNPAFSIASTARK